MSSNNPPSGAGQFGDFNPYQSPNPSPGLTGGNGGSGREEALARVKLPAIILMVLAPISMFIFAFDGVFRVMNIMNGFVPPGMDLNAPGVQFGFTAGQYGFLVVEILGFFLQVVVILGAYHMLTLKNRMLAKSANIISCVPCVTACCVFGIPFGIWGLVIVSDSAVSPYFES
jgi:hypothetical protein